MIKVCGRKRKVPRISFRSFHWETPHACMYPHNTFQIPGFNSACKPSCCHFVGVKTRSWSLNLKGNWMKKALCLWSFTFRIHLRQHLSDTQPLEETVHEPPHPWSSRHCHHPVLGVLSSTVLKPKKRGERKQSAALPVLTSAFSQVVTCNACQAEMNILCQSVKLVANKKAGSGILWSLRLRASSASDLWNPAPGSHPCAHASQTPHLYSGSSTELTLSENDLHQEPLLL